MKFYPDNAPVPEELRTSRAWLRPLRATDVELDYDAVMSSAEMLHTWSQGDWPRDGFTLAENLCDLQYHEREHIERKAFTFTVLNPAGTRCLGCVYIQPFPSIDFPLCKEAAYAAHVGFWVRQAEIDNDLDRHLLAILRSWFQDQWAFECVAYTVSQLDARQAELFNSAGMERSVYTFPDGREFWVFE